METILKKLRKIKIKDFVRQQCMLINSLHLVINLVQIFFHLNMKMSFSVDPVTKSNITSSA